MPEQPTPVFFSAPKVDLFEEGPFADIEKKGSAKPRKQTRKRKRKMRYAAYIRISSDEQIGNYSVDAQKRAIETWVNAQNGILVKVYTDEGHSGRTAERPAFQQMRKDARKDRFDALVVHKFDRFSRNRTDALAIKSLLRYDYGVKVFSVSEPSEDGDGPMGALIEGIMESVADWYSRNLAAEVAKGKKERSNQGMHNNRAPFGMKKDEDKVLVPDPEELPGLIMAFREYATGNYSDRAIAHLLNDAGYSSKTGRPFSKDTVRDILQNRTYLGEIKYQKYKRNSDGSRSYDAEVHWFEGQHEAVIDEELFEAAQEARAKRRTHRQATPKYNPYLLRNIAYCWRCCNNQPEGETFRNYGKMRPQSQAHGGYRYYRCRATDLGYTCEQKGVQVEISDEQVVHILKTLKAPEDWQKGVTKAISEFLGERDLDERVEEIREIIRRMDMRWDNGFITNEKEFIEQRLQLQQELEKLTPVPDDELKRAAQMLKEFPAHWERLEGQPEDQHALIKMIVKRVYIEDERVVGMTLRSNYHLVLGHNAKGPTEYTVDPFLSTYGSDGVRTRDLWLDRPAC